MRLTLRELRDLLAEAVGTRSHPDDKTHMICWVIAHAGRPLPREEIMRKVSALEGHAPEEFKPTSNHDYFAPSPVMRSDWERNEQGHMIQDPDGTFRRTPERMVPNPAVHARYSVLRRGFVKVAGKKGNLVLYDLTPEGEKLAAAADEWIKSRPDLFGDIVGSL
jgi:hypothetical protein